VIKLTLLIVLILAFLIVTTAMLGPWSVMACLVGTAGTSAIRARRRLRADPSAISNTDDMPPNERNEIAS
jgi:hypothetical protein